jgi:hypothetical protein
VDVANVPALLDQPEQQGCRDVVRQIAHDPQTAAIVEGGEIEFEGVGLVQMQGGALAAGRPQMTDGVAIDLDRMQLRQPRQQRQRDRTETGADLDHALLGARIDRRHDALDHAGIV